VCVCVCGVCVCVWVCVGVCVCGVHVCVCGVHVCGVCVWCGVCVCVCVCVALVLQHAARHVPCYIIICDMPHCTIFYPTLSHKRRDFRKTFTEHKMCVLIFCTTFV